MAKNGSLLSQLLVQTSLCYLILLFILCVTIWIDFICLKDLIQLLFRGFVLDVWRELLLYKFAFYGVAAIEYYWIWFLHVYKGGVSLHLLEKVKFDIFIWWILKVYSELCCFCVCKDFGVFLSCLWSMILLFFYFFFILLYHILFPWFLLSEFYFS
jgi:hypothetical protein